MFPNETWFTRESTALSSSGRGNHWTHTEKGTLVLHRNPVNGDSSKCRRVHRDGMGRKEVKA